MHHHCMHRAEWYLCLASEHKFHPFKDQVVDRLIIMCRAIHYQTRIDDAPVQGNASGHVHVHSIFIFMQL